MIVQYLMIPMMIPNCSEIFLPFLFERNIFVGIISVLIGSPSHLFTSRGVGNSLPISKAVGFFQQALGWLVWYIYTGCIKKNATSEFPKKSLCNS